MRKFAMSVLAVWQVFFFCSWLLGQNTASGAANAEQAIIESIRTYVDAYNRHDATAVASHWAQNAVMLAIDSGQRIEGREAIRADFAKQFESNPEAKLAVDVSSIRLVADTVAIEDGFATILDGISSIQTSYTVVHVKQSDGWKIDSVRETNLPDPSAAQLSDLEWLVGNWSDGGEHATVQFEVNWARSGRFLTMNFRVDSPDQDPLEGTQIIGVDPANGKIRSWLFDSDGGIGQGNWSSSNGSWVAEMRLTLPSGESATATNVYTPVDAGSYRWRSTARKIEGEFLPDVSEVLISRIP